MFRLGVLLCLAGTAGAQQSPDSTARRQQRMLDSLAAALTAVQGKLDSISSAPPPAAPARTSGAYMNVSFVGLTDFAWSSEKDLGALQVGDHEPHVRGFAIPNAELALDGTVDPYLKAFVNIVHKLDANGETGVELEEMYFLTTSLPHNLQVKGGQFFAEFGRQNPQHPHSWAFADQPLALNRMFGPEGLRSQGLRVSWLLPTSFYTEATVAVLNSAGTTTWSFRSDESAQIHAGAPVDRAVRGVGDMLYVPRLATSVDLSETQTLLFGVSGAFGPNNSGDAAKTRVYGADVYWKWKSPTARKGFPFVAFQGEGLVRRYDAASRTAVDAFRVALPAATLKDDGAYAQVQWGIRPMLVAGLRAEYATGNGVVAETPFTTAERANRNRYSTNLTWFPTEYSKFRIQYNYDHRAWVGNDHTVLLQFEFLLGAHAAHKF
jgi:hypothetical protein